MKCAHKDVAPTMKTLDLRMDWEFKSADAGTFTGYASIFGNVDLGGDIVERGAFEEIAKTKDGHVRVLLQHRMSDLVGKALVKQDDHGLHVDGTLILGMSGARNAYEAMKANILDGMSIGYDVLPNGDELMSSGVRKLKRLKLWEISLVTFGMNPLARVETVKARARQTTTIREFEELLREECGFSNAQAKLLAVGGWNALQKARDESGTENAAAMAGILKFLDTVSTS